MTIKIWNDFKKGGFVMLDYAILCCLEKVTAIVLCQLIAEYNHAENHNLNIDKLFLVNIKRLSDYLYLDYDEIKDAFYELKSFNLIDFYQSGIKNTILVRMNEEEIVEFKQQQELKNMLHDWDWGLQNAQNPQGQETQFNCSTNALIQAINNYIKKPKEVPMVIYSLCNVLIEQYESNGNNFLQIPNLENRLVACLSDDCFKLIDLVLFVQKICKE